MTNKTNIDGQLVELKGKVELSTCQQKRVKTIRTRCSARHIQHI